MTTEPQQQHDPAIEEEAPDNSLLTQLRQRREKISEEKEQPLDLEIPGYEGLLWARYKRAPWEQANKLVKKITKSKSDRADLIGACDLLILCCIGIYTKHDEDAELKFFADGFNDILAERLGFEANSAREVVQGVFNDEYSLIGQNNEVYSWLAKVNKEDLEDFEGES